MSEEKDEKIKNGETLTYPIPIRDGEVVKKLRETLDYIQEKSNEYLVFVHEEKLYGIFDEYKGKYAYKALEPLFAKLSKENKLPSRINRGVLETVGRTMRQMRHRKEVYDQLCEITKDCKRWSSGLLLKKEIFVKPDYVKNIKEQVVNFKRKHKRLPENFYDLQKPPKVKTRILTYAPDDEQAIKIKRTESGKIQLNFKVINREGEEIKWKWIETEIQLPRFLDNEQITSPDLRIDCLHGNWLPILDFKVTLAKPELEKSDNFITVDWGSRKLLTFCCFNKKGEQISQPIFLNFSPLQDKILRIRKDIDQWKRKRDKLHKDSLFKKCNREIARRWNKISNINKELAHAAANILVFTAKAYGCSKIYCENLKSLRSRRVKAPQLNWEVNTTVRQAIYNLVEYKARLCGISLQKPVNPAGTSSTCPKCSHKGLLLKSPDNKKRSDSAFPWFYCSHCHFSADRDYVACLNLARKVLFRKNLKKCTKTISYKKMCLPDLPFRQDAFTTTHCESRFSYLKGWSLSLSISSFDVQKRFNSFKGTIFGSLRV